MSFVVADSEKALEDMVLPACYNISIEGENTDLIESRVSILSALAISIVAVYLLLVSQFRSWIHPVTVMMAVPLSLVGVSFALWLGSRPVSMPVMVGLVLLVGTVVNNSILLIDIIRQHRDAGMERRQAIREGVSSRFRPIMMTSLSTVIGMVPLAMEWALGAERFSPLATAVIGGLLASTLLTLIVIPVLYDIGDGLTMPRLRGSAPAVVASLALLVGLTVVPAPARAQDMSLGDAWALTMDHPAARAAEYQSDAASAKAHAATARMMPQAELTARASILSYVEPALLQIPLVLPDGSVPDPIQFGEVIEESYGLEATVIQPIFTGGALLSGRKAARAGAEAAEAGQEKVMADLWLNVVEAWYGSAVANDVVEIQARVVAAAQSREQSLERMFEAGRATDIKLSAVSLKRAEAAQRHADVQINAAVASQGLAALLGQPASPTSVDVVAAARQAAAQSIETGEAAAVVQAEAQAKAAQAKSNAVLGSAIPRVALRFGAQYGNPNSRYFPPQNAWNRSWDASIVASWKLDGIRWHESSAAKKEANAARLGLEARQRQTDVERAKALAPIQTAELQLDVAAERIQVAERAVQATENALEQGRATAGQLLERESDLAMARAAEQRVALKVVLAVEKARSLSGRYGPK